MTSSIEQKIYTTIDQLKLFKSFAESVKLPLLQIARATELSKETGNLESLTSVSLAADTLTNLIDNYVLSLQLQAEGSQIELTPVSIGAVLDEAAHTLYKQANQSACDVELHIAGRYGPVMAHPKGLQAALVSLGQVLIDAQAEHQPSKRQVIRLAAHRTAYGVVAGMFTDIEGINARTLKTARNLFGSARQPLAELTSATSAGVFVADSLLSTMSSGLRVARYQKLSGLAATFTPSKQLMLV